MYIVHYALNIAYNPKIANRLPITIGTLEGIFCCMRMNPGSLTKITPQEYLVSPDIYSLVQQMGSKALPRVDLCI